MRFFSEAERMRHPEASKIPECIWEDEYCFNREISLFQIELMQRAPDGLALDLMQEDGVATNALKRQAWLAVALGHPDLSDEMLLDLLEQFKLTFDQGLVLVTASGRQTLLDAWVKTIRFFEEPLKWVQAWFGTPHERVFSDQAIYRALVLASGAGYLDMMQQLIGMRPKDSLIRLMRGDHYGAYCRAARYAQVDAMGVLRGAFTSEVVPMTSEGRYELLLSLMRANDFEGMDSYLTCLSQQEVQSLFSKYDFSIFRTAVIQGNERAADYLLAKQKEQGGFVHEMLAVANYNPFRESVRAGRLKIMLRLIQTIKEVAPEALNTMLMSNQAEAWRVAEKRGYQSIMEALLVYPVIARYANKAVVEAPADAPLQALAETEAALGQMTRVVSFTQSEAGVELQLLQANSMFRPLTPESDSSSPDGAFELKLPKAAML